MITSVKFNDPSNKTVTVIASSKTLGVPIDLNNRHWQEVLVWVAKGNTITAADPLPPPPTNDEIYDQVIQGQKVFKGYVLAINDGSIVPGSNMTGKQLKDAVKAKM